MVMRLISVLERPTRQMIKIKLEMRLNRYTEDLVRDVKHSDSELEPQQHFKRTADRNAANLQWSSRLERDWTVKLITLVLKKMT